MADVDAAVAELDRVAARGMKSVLLRPMFYAIPDEKGRLDGAWVIQTSGQGGENPVGVYVGLMWGDYQMHGVDSGPPHSWTTPHSFYWSVANRVSHYFNFSGPSITIDTACSSSLTAIHLACAAIRSGEVGAAIAGGVNLSLHANKYNALSDMRFLSTNGHLATQLASGETVDVAARTESGR